MTDSSFAPKAGADTDDQQIVDDAGADDTVVPEQYDIASYGADYDVDGLVRRLQRGDIFIPSFQRQYMWNQQEASRFIESLLLGLPVPGVFLAAEPETNKLLVIDGQQRLKSLQFYYEGFFNPKPDDKERKIFKLLGVQQRLEGRTYRELIDRDRLRLDNAIVHATVVKQEQPSDDDTSIYHIFERLNNGGRRLADQEIRAALYHGHLLDTISALNEHAPWRKLFGPRNKRLKDEEFILRFFALFYASDRYKKPMKEFLNRFATKNRNPSTAVLKQYTDLFRNTIANIDSTLGPQAFRLGGPINAAVFDSVMVGVATRLQSGKKISASSARSAYQDLMGSDEYMQAVSRATSDEGSVATRVRRAIEAFKRA